MNVLSDKRFPFSPAPEEEQLRQVEIMEAEDDENVIVLFNDEVNTFDHVIDSLISVCEHTAQQAQQCAMITHYKGKCEVLSGAYPDLEPKCSALLDRGLAAEIH